jgi:hypothetical protein
VSEQHKIGFDTQALDAKVVSDTDTELTMSAVIASEIVQQYSDGWAYKPADELEKMANVANRIGVVPVKVLEHPSADTNYLLLKHSDVHGVARNFQYVNNLIDTKTKRPMRKGVKADITWYKDAVDADVLDKARKGVLHDVSIGFTFDADPVKGEFNGVSYDYIQRNIFLNHVAAPIESGRCPGPICGIGYDSNQQVAVLDAKAIADCPVCAHMKEVGWGEAGKRLYSAYGPDVLEVIDTGKLPVVEPPKTTVAEDFAKQLEKFNSWFNKTNVKVTT